MPAESKAQRNLMGMALAYKRGKLDAASVPKGVLARVKQLAGSMSTEQLSDYASTKTERLPRHSTARPRKMRNARQ